MGDFDAFVAGHVEDLLRTAYLITWDGHEAEDLVQECLFKVARRWSRVSRMEAPLAYARRVLINLAIDGSRRRARRRLELEPTRGGAEAAVDPFAAHDDRDALRVAIAGLPLQQRAVLVLRYFNDLSEAETAKVLGCSVGTVKSRASRGLAQLRGVWRPVASRLGEE